MRNLKNGVDDILARRANSEKAVNVDLVKKFAYRDCRHPKSKRASEVDQCVSSVTDTVCRMAKHAHLGITEAAKELFRPGPPLNFELGSTRRTMAWLAERRQKHPEMYATVDELLDNKNFWSGFENLRGEDLINECVTD